MAGGANPPTRADAPKGTIGGGIKRRLEGRLEGLLGSWTRGARAPREALATNDAGQTDSSCVAQCCGQKMLARPALRRGALTPED